MLDCGVGRGRVGALLLALGARPVVQAAGTPPEDLDGVTRLQCVAMDLGAYGWGPPVVPA